MRQQTIGDNKEYAKIYYLLQAWLQLRNAYKQLLFKAIVHIKFINYQSKEKIAINWPFTP